MENPSTSSAHTKGPWKAVPDYSGTHWFVEHRMGGDTYTLVDDISEEADARLIAQAPSMLEDGQRLYDEIQHYLLNVDVTDSHLPQELTDAFDRFEATWNAARGIAA